MSKRHTDPRYYEANRIETGLNHVDYGRVSYCHISKERWDAIFGKPEKYDGYLNKYQFIDGTERYNIVDGKRVYAEDIRGNSGSRREQENTQEEFEDAVRKAIDCMDNRSGEAIESNDVGC